VITVPDKTLRMIDWGKALPVPKRNGLKCLAPYCREKELRETPVGIYCWRHYVHCRTCSKPGCRFPVTELGLCREHLNADDPEAPKPSLFQRSALAESSGIMPDVTSRRRRITRQKRAPSTCKKIKKQHPVIKSVAKRELPE
jgi:hypothetical protein